MHTRQGNDLLIIESHAVKHITQVLSAYFMRIED